VTACSSPHHKISVAERVCSGLSLPRGISTGLSYSGETFRTMMYPSHYSVNSHYHPL